MKRPAALVLAVIGTGVLIVGVWFAFAPSHGVEDDSDRGVRGPRIELDPAREGAASTDDAHAPESGLSPVSPAGLTTSAEPARAESKPPEPDSPRVIQARALRAALEAFKNGAPESDRRGETNDVLTYTIAAILDDAGRSKPRASALGPRAGEQLFVLNQREYRFQTGEFPEYDDFLAYARGVAQQVKTQSRSAKKEPPKFAPLDIELVKKIEARAQSALKLLEK